MEADSRKLGVNRCTLSRQNPRYPEGCRRIGVIIELAHFFCVFCAFSQRLQLT
jgi:hypothetical protein